MNKIFEVLISNKVYSVYSIQDKVHTSMNGEPDTWWLYYADELPEGLMPAVDSEIGRAHV